MGYMGMEAASLREALEKLQSDTTATSNQGLDSLSEWMSDTRNQVHAEFDPDTYHTIVKVLIRFMQKQVATLSKPGGKKTTFRSEGAAHLQQVVRAACSGRRGALARIQLRLWEHIEEVLRNDAVATKQPATLSYYCRVVRALAEHSALGYLADLRGELLQKVLHHLLAISSRDAQTAALDAAAHICRFVDADPSAEVPWVSERALALLSSGNQSVADCFMAICLRCPLAFRDWLFADGHSDQMTEAFLTSWSSKTSEALDLVLRLALGFGAPLRCQHVAGLLKKVADTLEGVARTETGLSSDLRVARLAELLAALVLNMETTPDAIGQRICTMLEQRCLPWALCVVRLCEGSAHYLFGDRRSSTMEFLLKMFDSLSRLFSRTTSRATAEELTAVRYALAAILAARAWGRIWPAGRRLPTLPVPLSILCGEGPVASLLSPDLISLLPPTTCEATSAWETRMKTLAEHVLATAVSGLSAPRGLHCLLGTLLLTTPPASIEGVARQFLSHQIAARSESLLKSPSPWTRSCVLAALRWHQTDATSQNELLVGMFAETVELRASFLRLCAMGGRWISPVRSPEDFVSFGEDDEDVMCAHVQFGADGGIVNAFDDELMGENYGSASGDTSVYVRQWFPYRYSRLLLDIETRIVDVALNAPTGTVGGIGNTSSQLGAIVDDLRVHNLIEATSFRIRPTPWQLGHVDIVGGLPDAPTLTARDLAGGGSAASTAFIDSFFGQAKDFLAACKASSEDAVITDGGEAVDAALTRSPISVDSCEKAIQLLPNMNIALRLPRQSGNECLSIVTGCMMNILRIVLGLVEQDHDATRFLSPILENLCELLNLNVSLRTDESKGISSSSLLDAPELAKIAFQLAQVIDELWAPRSGTSNSNGACNGRDGNGVHAFTRETSDLFESRSVGNTSTATKHRGPKVSRLLVLRALVALAQTWPGPEKSEGKPACVECLRQLLLRVLQTEPTIGVAVVRVVSLELAKYGARCNSALLDVTIQAWCCCSEPIAPLELEDLLHSALRITRLVAGGNGQTRECLRTFCLPMNKRDSCLMTVLKSWPLQSKMHLGPRGKTIIAVLSTQMLGLLRDVSGLDIVKQDITAFCSDIVCDFILNDRNSEVRLNVGIDCTKALLELFDDTQVFPVFADAWEPLLRVDGPAKPTFRSDDLALVGIMLAICTFRDYARRVLPDLCNLRVGASPVIRNVLVALDEALVGKQGVAGTSRVALALRARIFATHLRKGRRLTDISLANLALELPARPPRSSFGRHLVAFVAALAVTEELDQLQDLERVCGFSAADHSEFELLTFVPLAGTILPLHPSMESLRNRFGSRAAALCKQYSHQVLAFSLQLPFLTADSANPVDGQKIMAAFSELGPQSPWTDFKAFVSKNFHYLLVQLDRILEAWARWSPLLAVNLLRNFVDWVGPLPGARLRLILPTLYRHGCALSKSAREQICTVIDVVISSNAVALGSLTVHQDESLRELLVDVEREWASKGARQRGAEQISTRQSPSLIALVAVLRGLRQQEQQARARLQQIDEHGVDWLRLQVDAMLPRLRPEAQQLLKGELDSCDGPGGATNRPAKKRRQNNGQKNLSVLLQPLAPPVVGLAWGPPAAPDPGALVQCFMELDTESCAGHKDMADSDGTALACVLRILARPAVVAQIQHDGNLARMVAQGLAKINVHAVLHLGDDAESEVLEMALNRVAQRKPQIETQQLASDSHQDIEELFCCGALLGATMLQAHFSAHVRRAALFALQWLRRLQIFNHANQLLRDILDERHLCLQDLKDIQPSVEEPKSHANGDSNWDFFSDLCTTMQDYSSWVRVLCSKMLSMGNTVWDKHTSDMMLACAPLAQCVDWFAERMLVLAILKAAVQTRSGRQLAKAISTLLSRESIETAQAQCIIRSLDYVRRYMTCKLRRAVPHFPTDGADSFWSALDLYAVAEGALRVGCVRDSWLFLELHLARSCPDVAIDQTILKSADERVGIDELFRTPNREVNLLHGLAKQLPDDEIIYGVSQWCHTTSRLVRAELGHDHLLQLQLHSGLREAELHAAGQEQLQALASSSLPDPCVVSVEGSAQVGLDNSLARLGLYTVFADASPVEGASAAIWEKRMEGLWRLRQWGDGGCSRGSHGGGPSLACMSPSASASNASPKIVDPPAFHAKLYGALASLAVASPTATKVHATLPSAAVAVPSSSLESLVAEVASTLRARSLEHLKAGMVQLQMLGSVFDVLDALREDSNTHGKAVVATSARWSSMANSTLSAPHFHLIEPLSAVRSTLLALAGPALVQLRFLTTLAVQAREAMQLHRALGLLEQAHRVSTGAPRSDLLRLHWEQARCFWNLRQQQECISIARAVATECRKAASQPGAATGPDQVWMARALSDTGLWLSASRLEASDVIQAEYLEQAVNMAPHDVKPRRQLAEFLDAKLNAEIERQNSMEHAMTSQAHKRAHTELEKQRSLLRQIESRPSSSTEAELKSQRDYFKTLERTCEQDRQQQHAERERFKELALACLRQMGQCLIESANAAGNPGEAEHQRLKSVACRFLSIWFDFSREYPEVTNSVRELLPKLPIGLLSPFLYQLASRMGAQDELFKQTLEELLKRIVCSGPHHLWPLLLLKNGDNVPAKMRGAEKFVADKDKIEAAKRLLERLRKEARMRPILEATEALSKFYLGIALYEVDKTKRQSVKIKPSDLDGYRQLQPMLKRLPIPTADPAVDGGQPAPCIAGFDTDITITEHGLSAPKVVRVKDTSGKEHVQIVKGHDDLRQDAVMQQLFRLLNGIFCESSQSREEDLRIRTFHVVPLTPCAGIMEFVDALTLGKILTGNNSPTDHGAHGKYRSKDWAHPKARAYMQQARENYNKGERNHVLEKAYQEVCSRFKPVMHQVFLEFFPSPQSWHRARQHYARSTAVSSIVGYIVGIGDRHPNNILFDKRTGEVIHIDFGYTFDQAKALRVPEIVPCRLTRDMVDGLGCLGTCGLFRYSCETTLGALRESSALVNSVVEVFVHDPVYNWSLSPWKSRQQDGTGSADHGAAQEIPLCLLGAGAGAGADGNEMAKRALRSVKAKLQGEHGSAVLGVPASVGWIIREAMDPNNLARMYFGWSQWL